MSDKRPMSALAAAIAGIATKRGDAPIILVSVKPEGKPGTVREAVNAIAEAIGYDPVLMLLAHATAGDLAPGVRAGAALARHAPIDTLHILDASTTAHSRFVLSLDEGTVVSAIARINEAPLVRKPIVAILPDGVDVLPHIETLIRATVPVDAGGIIRVQL